MTTTEAKQARHQKHLGARSRRQGHNQPTRRAPASEGTSKPPWWLEDADFDQARTAFETAFSLLGLVSDGIPQCPNCGTTKKGKVAFNRAKAYWKCYRCSTWGTLLGTKTEPGLLAQHGGYSRGDAVRVLVGKPLRGATKAAPRPVTPIDPVVFKEFQAAVDTAVYERLLQLGSSDAAQQFFGRWHIDSAVTAQSRAVLLVDADSAYQQLLAEFGRDRLIACGMVKPGEDGKPDFPMFTRRYPVVEPHLRPDGVAVGLQFRASETQEQQIASYDRRKAEYEATKAKFERQRGPGTFDPSGRKAPRYAPKFLSLRGGIPGQHLIGCGLPEVHAAPPGTRVYVVEGFKDMLAARTMGVVSYAIPGAQQRPHPRVCAVLKPHVAVMCLDGDQTGQAAQQQLVTYLQSEGVRCEPKAPPLPAGFDVTDELVDRFSRHGCRCDICRQWRQRRP